MSGETISSRFQGLVGLKGSHGEFSCPSIGGKTQALMVQNHDALTGLNDSTDLGFKGILNLMKEHPEWMFTNT